jgi:hypothetical protein
MNPAEPGISSKPTSGQLALSIPSGQLRPKARSVVPKAIRTLSDSCIANALLGLKYPKVLHSLLCLS